MAETPQQFQLNMVGSSRIRRAAAAVNFGEYMNFKKASDSLFDQITHAELAETINVSVAAIRQARLSRAAKAYREPPKDWRRGIVLVAQERIARLRWLISRLKGNRS